MGQRQGAVAIPLSELITRRPANCTRRKARSDSDPCDCPDLPKVLVMLYLIVKAGISGLLIAAVSEISKRSPAIGAIVLSLPLVSILSFVWVWKDTGDTLRIASLAEGTFWFILPTLPMFFIFPMLLRHGISFWIGLMASCALTIALYFVTAQVLGRFGINI
jgi:hypothetical protein